MPAIPLPARERLPAWERTTREAPPQCGREGRAFGTVGSQAGAWEPDEPQRIRRPNYDFPPTAHCPLPAPPPHGTTRHGEQMYKKDTRSSTRRIGHPAAAWHAVTRPSRGSACFQLRPWRRWASGQAYRPVHGRIASDHQTPGEETAYYLLPACAAISPPISPNLPLKCKVEA